MGSCSEQADVRAMQHLRRKRLGRYRYVRMRWRVLFAVVDLLGGGLLAIARAIGRVSGSPATGNADRLEDPGVILLVQLDHMGDAIITASMLPALRNRYPDASIEVLASSSASEVFRAAEEIDHVHVARTNRFARGILARLAWIPGMIAWGLSLRRRRVDIAIDPRGDFPSILIMWLCGARRRLGWDCGGGGFLLTDVAQHVHNRPEHESRMALLHRLGIDADGVRRCVAEKDVNDSPPNAAQSPRIVLHIGAGTRSKQWPLEHWRELLGRLVVELDARITLVGSKAEQPIARRILDGRAWPRVVDRTGELSYGELAALLRQADIHVGADSGPAHLAASVGTPVVVLFSGTNNATQWQPRCRHVAVLRHPVACSPCHRDRCPMVQHPCMKGLSPAQVFDQIAHQWSDGGAVPTPGAMPTLAWACGPDIPPTKQLSTTAATTTTARQESAHGSTR